MTELVERAAALVGVTFAGDLDALSRLLCDRLLSEGVDAQSVRDLSSAVCELQELSLQLTQDRVARRALRIAGCERGLGRLRTVTTASVLIDRVCDELARSCGFERVLLSQVDADSLKPWMANEVAAGEAWFPEWADRRVPFRELGLESGLTTDHRPALVRDTEGRRVHSIITTSDSRSFVVAPLRPAGRVVGFFHADHGAGGRACDETDRDVLWAFTEGFAHLYERTALLDRLRDQRWRVRETLGAVDTALEDLTEAEIELVLAPDNDTSVTRTASTVTRSHEGLRRLTQREREILTIIAEGATNTEIAERLVLSVGTVKTHVKHILAKLGAVNRSHAIAQFLGADGR